MLTKSRIRNYEKADMGRIALIVITICFSSAEGFNLKNISSFLPPGLPAAPPFNYSAGVWEGFRNLTDAHKGDNMEGMMDLKNYFQRFGYLANPAEHNITEEYDDLMESAVKMYQRTFGLNVTGNLDTETLSQIMMPRCGMQDIINGTSAMRRNIINGTVSHHQQYKSVRHYAYFPGSPRWSYTKRDLTYAFSPENEVPSKVSMTDMKPVMSRAFARWAAVIPITFTETEDYDSADLKIGFFSGDHGDGEPFDGVLGVLAHSFSPEDGRFHLDAAESWTVDVKDDDSSTAIDLESVATHEIGHLLGLGHTPVKDAIMYPSIAPRTKKVDLALDDVQGVQNLYGSNPNYDPNSISASGHQSETSDANTVIGSLPLISTAATSFLSLMAFLLVIQCL